PARVAVIGVGMMGRNHARIYRELAGTSLVGVCDTNPEVAAQIAGIYGTRAYGSYEQLLTAERPDGVSVCVPTEQHKAVTLAALASGCHVLVEKPIAASIGDADELLAAARSTGRVLAVGHVERFNPAVIAL